ncbi:MAG TPA: hypothetical protein VFF50_00670 [Candidatus Deferrimicrobiaceae bacterium]|nr:hypothetical protein [Candidatus Deferrimicrobiaceae bacterium]
MRRLPIVLALCCVLGELAIAQKTQSPQHIQLPPQVPIFSAAELAAKVPAARSEDVNSMSAILHAIYDVISGPAGGRDWNRFRSLFLPQARFTEVSTGPDGSKMVLTWNVDEFIRDAGEVFSKDPFYENGIVNRPQSFGNITQVFSSYQSRRSPTDKPFERGINSIQLLNDGKRWWVVSILWDTERAGNPLPTRFAKN